MPVELVIITGLPCSGKTHRTQQIAAAFSHTITHDPSNSKRSVQVVNSHHASSDPSDNLNPSPTALRDQIYNSAAQEKTARAEEFSAIKRAVSKDNVVIADGLNYIKGYRYQLWCEAKAAGTRCCVVHVAAQEDECKAWNRERLRASGRDGEAGDDEPQTGARDMTRSDKDGSEDVMPQSHTAIYGDRVIGTVKRSRSSSVDADAGDDTLDMPRPEDTMTLKSLYISDRKDSMFSTSIFQSSIQSSNSTQTQDAALIPSIPTPPPSSAHAYAPTTLTSLIMRYEPPSPFSRWDTPLFTIPSTDTHPPYTAIWIALFPPPTKPTSKKALSQLPRQPTRDSEDQSVGSKNTTMTLLAGADRPPVDNVPAVRQHAATVLPTATSASALQLLESTTLEVVKHILAAARQQDIAVENSDGGFITLSIPLHASSEKSEVFEAEISIPQGMMLSQPLLQRLRRKYTQLQRAAIAHGREYAGMREGRAGVVRGFVSFVEGEMGD